MICEHKVVLSLLADRHLYHAFSFSLPPRSSLGVKSEWRKRRRSSGEWAESGAPHENAKVSGLQ